jgi:hypothetical protein
MKRAIILRDERSGEYFTNDYECWWSRDIKDAYRLKDLDEVEQLIEIRLGYEHSNGFEDVQFLEAVTIYVK